jgi:hypothetical protein
MKLTSHKKQWVLDRVDKYCQLLQIEPPTVILTRKEYEDWKEQKREERRQRLIKLCGFAYNGYMRVGRGSRYLGVCHRIDKMIVILIKKSPNLSRLDQTIRHELIHYARPSYNHHSKEFRDRMERLLKGKVKDGKFVK